jgi:hypothetical protein
MSGVRLTSDEEFSALVILVFSEESDEELPEIVGDFSLVVSELIETDFAETSANWLINKDKVGVAVPRVRVGSKIKVILNRERTIFSKETSQRRASRTAIKPDNKGISRRGRARFKMPVKNITTLSNGDEASSVCFI